MGREMGGRFKREGAYVYLWLIHVDIWQKTTKLCKAIILQLKKNKKEIRECNSFPGIYGSEAQASHKIGHGL